MEFDKKRLAQMRALCDEIGPDDGVDPRILSRDSRRSRRRDDRRLRQLCGQVQRVLRLTLTASPDPILQALDVAAVEPDPDAARLRLIVRPLDLGLGPGDVLPRLEAARGWLRGELTVGLRRKRTPDLSFGWLPPEVSP